MTSGPHRPREILPLTGIRFPLTLAVLFLHLAAQDFKPAGGSRIPLFFVISGFVMAAAYFPRPGTGLSPIKFWCRRFARLYPLLVLTTCSIAFWFYRDQALPHWHGGHAGPAFARSVACGLGITLFPPTYLLGPDAPAPNGYAWFVMVELSVGLLLPFFIPFLWRLTPRWSIIAALAFPVSADLLQTLVLPHLPWFANPYLGRFDLRQTPIHWLGIFLFGATMYRLYAAARESPLFAQGVGKLATPFALLTLWLVFSNLPYASHRYGSVLVYYQLGLTLCALSLSGGWAARALSCTPLLYLGRRSYSIYMISGPLGYYLLPATIGSHGAGWISEHGRGGSIAVILIVCLTGLAVYRLVELPSKRWVGDRLDALVRQAFSRRKGLQAPQPLATA